VPSRSRSHRATLARRLPLAASVLVVVGLTAAPRSLLPVASADPPGIQTRAGDQRSPAGASAPGRPAGSGPLRQSIGSAEPRLGAAHSGRVPALRPPVRGQVVRGFEPPAGPYGPGHRGIDLAAPLGAAVRAPAGGRVVFAGQVAGRGWVSVAVAAGVVVTVGPLDRPVVAAGQQVVALSQLGGLAAGHPGGLHLSVRVDGVYVDPLPYLVGAGPPRLAPLPLRDRRPASAEGEQLHHFARARLVRYGRGIVFAAGSHEVRVWPPLQFPG
jgi:Peptidase family M23